MVAIKRKKATLFLLGLLLGLLLLFVIPWQKHYVFVSADSNKMAAYLPFSEDSFQIKYTHTIHRSDVVESYKVLGDGSLMATELQYEDFSIGMPSNAENGEVFIEEDGKYFIKNMERKMADFRIFIGDVDADLIFLVRGKEIDLKKVLKRGKAYTVKVQHLSIIQQLNGVKLDEQKRAT